MHGTFKTIETKADPFSLESLIAWLEKQPADKKYDYFNCQGACLIDQYFGRITSFAEYHDICERTNWGAEIAGPMPHTFGAALDRARAALVQS